MFNISTEFHSHIICRNWSKNIFCPGGDKNPLFQNKEQTCTSFFPIFPACSNQTTRSMGWGKGAVRVDKKYPYHKIKVLAAMFNRFYKETSQNVIPIVVWLNFGLKNSALAGATFFFFFSQILFNQSNSSRITSAARKITSATLYTILRVS